MNKVLKSIDLIVENSVHVRINRGNVDKFCKGFERKDVKNWMKYAPFDVSSLSDRKRLGFLFVFNSLSFCYWGDPKWIIDYKGKQYDGSFGMIASLGRTLEGGYPILDPIFLKNINLRETFTVLEGEGSEKIPLLEERWKILRELGDNTVRRFDGQFENIVKQGEGYALELVDVITTNFPSFNDFHDYNGRSIYFNKRAQLLVSDIIHEFGGIEGIEDLTACADYKIPQVLRREGILDYSELLSKRIDSKDNIHSGSQAELEIRANTVKAIELIKEGLQKRFPGITSKEINDYLWLLGQEKKPDDKPYHLTRTINY